MTLTRCFTKLIVLLYLSSTTTSIPLTRRQSSAYAPVQHSCPSTPLVRPANGISNSEFDYFVGRKIVASVALELWLLKVNPGFLTVKWPSIGLATSGGGLRSTFEGAGVLQAFDARDSNASTSGLYQALTYHSGLSGGSLLLSSVAASNWATISSIKTSLWDSTFAQFATPEIEAAIFTDLAAKSAAGFVPTLADAFGRLMAWGLFSGPDGGVADTLSGLASKSGFLARLVPYPIITAIQVSIFHPKREPC
jgi:lysophospholipase